MTAALIRLSPLAILAGPWAAVPGRVEASGIRLDAAAVGWTDGTASIVSATISGSAPTPYHSVSSYTGLALSNGTLSATAVYSGPSLSDLQTLLRTRIDLDAEATRLLFITDGSGQSMAYEAKKSEADAWHTAGEPSNADATAYPWAGARASRLSVTVASVLADWKAKGIAWAVAGRAIENVREAGKDAVAAAASVDAAYAAYAALSWPQPS